MDVLWELYQPGLEFTSLLLFELHFAGRYDIVTGVMKSRDKILICSLCNALGPFLLSSVIAIPCLPAFICWLFMRGDADAEVADYARRRLNVAISWTIWFYASLYLCLIIIGFIPLFILGIWWIIACVKDLLRASSEDTSYRFGLTIPFIRPRKSGDGEP